MTALLPSEALYIICHQEWRPVPRWRGRYRALYRSLRNSGHCDAHTSAVIRTGKEYVRELGEVYGRAASAEGGRDA